MFVINLPERTDRLKAFQQNNNHLPFTVVSGVDKEIAKKHLDNGLLKSDPLITNGEVGCFLAHINIWRRISLDPLITMKDFVLISEDDVSYCSDFLSQIENMKHHIPDNIRFVQCIKFNDAKGIIDVVEPKKLDRTTTASYLIRKDLCSYLVQQFDKNPTIYIADLFSTYLNEPLGCTNLNLVKFNELSKVSDIMPEVFERFKFLLRTSQ